MCHMVPGVDVEIPHWVHSFVLGFSLTFKLSANIIFNRV